MNSKKNCRTYREIFNEWNKNRTPLRFRDKIYYNPQPDEEYRQCYLPTTCKNERFYKARHCLPKHWFVSNYGTIITVKRGKPELIVGQFTDYDRMQVSFYYKDDRYTLARESLVALVFNDSVPCTEEATKLIEKKGLIAFNRRSDFQCVELHHINGYIHPQDALDILQIMQNLPSNCASDAIQLITRFEHFQAHHPIPSKNVA